MREGDRLSPFRSPGRQRVGTAAMGTLAELARHSCTVRSAPRMPCTHRRVQDRGGIAYVRERNAREVDAGTRRPDATDGSVSRAAPRTSPPALLASRGNPDG